MELTNKTICILKLNGFEYDELLKKFIRPNRFDGIVVDPWGQVISYPHRMQREDYENERHLLSKLRKQIGEEWVRIPKLSWIQRHALRDFNVGWKVELLNINVQTLTSMQKKGLIDSVCIITPKGQIMAEYLKEISKH